MKNKAKMFFFRWKICLIFKTFCFQQPLMVLNNAPLSSRVTAKKSCRSLYIVSRCLWHSMARGNMGQNHLSSWKQLFFERFVSIDLLGHKEMFLSFAQKCWKTLWNLINCLLTFVMFDNTIKNSPKCFFQRKVALFFQKFVFSTA